MVKQVEAKSNMPLQRWMGFSALMNESNMVHSDSYFALFRKLGDDICSHLKFEYNLSTSVVTNVVVMHAEGRFGVIEYLSQFPEEETNMYLVCHAYKVVWNGNK